MICDVKMLRMRLSKQRAFVKGLIQVVLEESTVGGSATVYCTVICSGPTNDAGLAAKAMPGNKLGRFGKGVSFTIARDMGRSGRHVRS